MYIRKKMRLESYDYASSGMVFVTICVQEKKCLLGSVENNQIALNDVGKMVDQWWKTISDKYKSIEIDSYCIMPNHVHGIIRVGAHPGVRPNKLYPYSDDCDSNGQTHGSAPTVGTIVQWFKTMTTNEYMRNVKNKNWERFNGRIWQRNYYDSIIRNANDLNKIREYIVNNPANWGVDENNLNKE